ncbi:MAG TPA: hypothetical protein VMT03_21930 [Polyangia bacterium]|nr:hypothetical protein [Polyangia bacterium]
MDASPFAPWANFYVIIGGAAAALTGLQFVVLVLGAEMRAVPSEHTARVFGTPTIVHFGAALLNSAILSAPWHRTASAAAVVAVFACVGMIFTTSVMRHVRHQRDYVPVTEDWIWHVIFPMLSYAGLLVSGLLIPRAAGPALFGVGAVSLMLLFIGIHNAWDSVVYIAVDSRNRRLASEESKDPK